VNRIAFDFNIHNIAYMNGIRTKLLAITSDPAIAEELKRIGSDLQPEGPLPTRRAVMLAALLQLYEVELPLQRDQMLALQNGTFDAYMVG
jgi:hypothetical protein